MMLLALAILTTLFLYSMLLLGQMRLFTVYLDLRFDSKWEKEWGRFRNRVNVSMYSWAGALIFQTLGLLSLIFLRLLWTLGGGGDQHFALNTAVQVILGLLYESLIFLTTLFRHRIFNEARIREHWKHVLEQLYDGTTSRNLLKFTAAGRIYWGFAFLPS
jgi:hypothetical protein